MFLLLALLLLLILSSLEREVHPHKDVQLPQIQPRPTHNHLDFLANCQFLCQQVVLLPLRFLHRFRLLLFLNLLGLVLAWLPGRSGILGLSCLLLVLGWLVYHVLGFLLLDGRRGLRFGLGGQVYLKQGDHYRLASAFL
jgi:hypothetical protein